MGTGSIDQDIGNVCSRAVPDIGTWPLFEGVYALGSRALDSYIVVPEAKLRITEEIVSRLNGARSLASIAEEYRVSRGQIVDVAGLHARLAAAGLLVGSKPSGELERLAVTLVDIPVESLFRNMASVISHTFIPLVWLTGLFALAGIGLAANRPAELLRLATGHIVMAPALFYSIVVLCYAGSILWHELSHAFTAIHCGLVPSRISVVGYLVIIPLFVIRIPGIYLIPPRQRIRIWAAGMWGSFGLAGIAAVAVHFAPVSLPWQQVLARIAFANGLAAVANLMPFMITDGYFILSTVCRQTNIRRRAWVALKELVRSRRSPNALLLTYLVLSAILTGGLLILNIRRIYWLEHTSTTGFAAILLLIFFALARVLLKVRASRRHSLGRE
jgi:hypothetical protein